MIVRVKRKKQKMEKKGEKQERFVNETCEISLAEAVAKLPKIRNVQDYTWQQHNDSEENDHDLGVRRQSCAVSMSEATNGTCAFQVDLFFACE